MNQFNKNRVNNIAIASYTLTGAEFELSIAEFLTSGVVQCMCIQLLTGDHLIMKLKDCQRVGCTVGRATLDSQKVASSIQHMESETISSMTPLTSYPKSSFGFLVAPSTHLTVLFISCI